MPEQSDRIPHGYRAIGQAAHPRTGTDGILVQSYATGEFALAVGEQLQPVPQTWAAKAAPEISTYQDAIQERCIARMEELGLNPNQLAESLDGKVSRSHVCRFLTRRGAMGSHKLQYLLNMLRLKIADE